MALQRPIPPPRRSKLLKPTSSDVSDLDTKFESIGKDEESANGNNDSELLLEKEDGLKSQRESSISSAQSERLSSSITLGEEPKLRDSSSSKFEDPELRSVPHSYFTTAVSNPEYDSRTI